MDSLENKLEQAIWIGKSLFNRNKVSGSSANMSFLHDNKIYITGSGTCFGNLNKEDFSVLSREGEFISGKKPSKELPLHKILYDNKENVTAVIHTHSFYSTMWSSTNHENEDDCIPQYTPYLSMKIGKIGLINYAPPGTKELFNLFEERVNKSDGYILKNHGPVVGHKNLMEAFYALEELEESAKIAWHFKINEEAVKGNLINK
jgi:3-dehydro-4-phosphotetronate decarboxylase